MIGYIIGMLTTLGVMGVFQHAQPALLYLDPAVLISLWGTALLRGELMEMWEFSEALTGDQLEDNDGKTVDAEQQPKGLFERLWHEIWTGSQEEKKADKSTEAGKEKRSTTGRSKEGDEKKDGSTKKEDKLDDQVLVSFTVSRISARRTTSAGKSNGDQNGAAQ
jgi:minor histocompatibility antigen H13